MWTLSARLAAMEACEKLPGEKTVAVQFIYKEWLIIAVENPIADKPKKDRAGQYISTKGKGHGYGMESMERAARKYGGRVQTEATAQKFTVEILLQKIN